MVVILILWCLVMLYFFMTDGSSISQSAFPFSNIGFFNNFPIVLLNRSAKTARLLRLNDLYLIISKVKFNVFLRMNFLE